jgi:hypothetical protein
MPSFGLEEMAKVMTFGAHKYAPHNFRLGMKYSRLWNGALRHLWAWLNGEDNDPESGVSHLAHCACCVLMLLDLQLLGKGDDDRWKSS